MNYINFNGTLVTGDTPIVEAGNRGLRYGDGLFETIKYKNNEFQLLHAHLDRLWKGLNLLNFTLPKLLDKTYLEEELLKLVKKNKHTHARVRLTIIRSNGGLYDAVDMHPVFIIESWQLQEGFGKINSNGLQLCIYKNALKSCDSFSNIKHNNFLPYVMGALFAKKSKCNDAIILNQHGRICDTTIANIFIIKNDIIYTPALNEGCIKGTIRHLLLENLMKARFEIKETAISQTQLLEADEIFVSNAMTPIKWVAGIDGYSFSNTKTLDISHKMHQTFPGIFC